MGDASHAAVFEYLKDEIRNNVIKVNLIYFSILGFFLFDVKIKFILNF